MFSSQADVGLDHHSYLCGVEVQEPALAMLLELYRRTMSQETTEVCDIVGVRRPVAKSYKALDHLLRHELVCVASSGKRFRRLALSPAALAEMSETFADAD